MLVDIDRIVVGDRIRKDFGDIQELADDIRDNGLINPPVVNKEYQLLAGERRLRACKSLGWPQIEVRMMDTRDAEHELNIEISENDVRKGFTKSERVDYIKRLLRIEQAKAKERQDLGLKSDEGSRADDATAKQFGIGRDTMRRELFIADNADLLDPSDFADWDEGKLSTNKAYQRIRAAKEQAERERDEAREDAEGYGEEIRDLQEEIAALEKQNDELYELANTQQVVEREVVREVAPEDYEDVKRRVRELEGSNRLYADDNRSLRKQLEEAQSSVYDHERIMDAARLEADVFLRKYSELSELADVIAAIDQFLSE